MSTAPLNEFKYRLHRLSCKWIDHGLPTREALNTIADELTEWKRRHRVNGIWPARPCMATATLDDGMGYGLAVIERYAAVMGMEVKQIGLLKTAEDILAACNDLRPDFLGLTVLHPDSDDALASVGHRLPSCTCLIAGGPAFVYDPALADRCAVAFVASHVADFIDFVLDWAPSHAAP